MSALTSQEALARAQAQTGLSDFGGTHFLEGLDRTLAAFRDVPLKPEARAKAETWVINALVNRLTIEQWYRRHPEVDEQTVEGPVVVTGLPRTGTTATVALLALDPRFRFTRAWEGYTPVPPPIAAEEEGDPRAVAARAMAKTFAHGAMHLDDPDGPEEDLTLLAPLNFRSYLGQYPMPDGYLDWWLQSPFGTTYEYHRRVLKLLQSRRPPHHWLLKSPLHLCKLDDLIKVYPNVRIIMTHRDPAQVVSSVASFSHALYTGACELDSLDKVWTGGRGLSFWSEGMRRGLAARSRLDDGRFIDVYNRDLVRDPVRTLEQIYDLLGMTPNPELRQRWAAYQLANPPGKDGGHSHRPEDFGLDASTIRARFKDYIDRFDV